jgi:hypothetical protein
LWPKTDVPGYAGNYSSPSQHGFDQWIQTEAEASNSMPNCGCFPVNHTSPGPKPPSGYPSITPHGDQCVVSTILYYLYLTTQLLTIIYLYLKTTLQVGGGHPSDWCYPCTNYYQPNATDPRGVSAWPTKIPGNDATFVVDRFVDFLQNTISDNKNFYAHLTFHAIHEPHPAMPEFYDMYEKDPDYLGALTMFDVELGRLIQELKIKGVYNNTVILYTADNGPHQGMERSDIHYSTNFLRQCKASIFEGGIRVPGIIHSPMHISSFINVTTPTVTSDFLPTIMELLNVQTDNPTWVMDGMSLVNTIKGNTIPNADRPKYIGVKWGSSEAIIDNQWKLMSKPTKGQCDFQEPYASMKKFDKYYLFDLSNDYHELYDQKIKHPSKFREMVELMNDFKASLLNSQQNESGCGRNITI